MSRVVTYNIILPASLLQQNDISVETLGSLDLFFAAFSQAHNIM